MKVEAMIQELAQLRRGHGLHAQDLLERLGPGLRDASRIDGDDPPGAARLKLARCLAGMANGLPPDLKLAVLAAWAMPPASEQRFLKDRMIWLGRQLDRDPRTAARRVESGFALLAERLLSERQAPSAPTTEYAPEGWYVGYLRSTLLLNADPVQLLETRRVVATRPGLERLEVSWSVPRATGLPDDTRVQVEVHYGGKLELDPHLSNATYWSGHLTLPRPLAEGEEHEYQVLVSSVSPRFFRPYYVVSPYRRCDRFELRAKFDPARTPQRIWKLDGVPYRLVDEELCLGEALRPDSVGEVQVRFSNLFQGLSYGLQWTD
jgi:hypothetical protein